MGIFSITSFFAYSLRKLFYSAFFSFTTSIIQLHLSCKLGIMKKIVLLIVVLLILGGAYGFYLFNKKTPGLENVTPDYTLTAQELYDAFSLNEKSALEKYEGKVLQINGDILTFSKTDSISNVVFNAEDALFGAVNCSFNKLELNLEKNETIEVKGRCQGFLNSVILNNCVIVNKH